MSSRRLFIYLILFDFIYCTSSLYLSIISIYICFRTHGKKDFRQIPSTSHITKIRWFCVHTVADEDLSMHWELIQKVNFHFSHHILGVRWYKYSGKTFKACSTWNDVICLCKNTKSNKFMIFFFWSPRGLLSPFTCLGNIEKNYWFFLTIHEGQKT